MKLKQKHEDPKVYPAVLRSHLLAVERLNGQADPPLLVFKPHSVCFSHPPSINWTPVTQDIFSLWFQDSSASDICSDELIHTKSQRTHKGSKIVIPIIQAHPLYSHYLSRDKNKVKKQRSKHKDAEQCKTRDCFESGVSSEKPCTTAVKKAIWSQITERLFQHKEQH